MLLVTVAPNLIRNRLNRRSTNRTLIFLYATQTRHAFPLRPTNRVTGPLRRIIWIRVLTATFRDVRFWWLWVVVVVLLGLLGGVRGILVLVLVVLVRFGVHGGFGGGRFGDFGADLEDGVAAGIEEVSPSEGWDGGRGGGEESDESDEGEGQEEEVCVAAMHLVWC